MAEFGFETNANVVKMKSGVWTVFNQSRNADEGNRAVVEVRRLRKTNRFLVDRISQDGEGRIAEPNPGCLQGSLSAKEVGHLVNIIRFIIPVMRWSIEWKYLSRDKWYDEAIVKGEISKFVNKMNVMYWEEVEKKEMILFDRRRCISKGQSNQRRRRGE